MISLKIHNIIFNIENIKNLIRQTTCHYNLNNFLDKDKKIFMVKKNENEYEPFMVRTYDE